VRQDVKRPELRKTLRLVHAGDCSSGIRGCKSKKNATARLVKSGTVARRRKSLANGYDGI
jgi:hypothetical protein